MANIIRGSLSLSSSSIGGGAYISGLPSLAMDKAAVLGWYRADDLVGANGSSIIYWPDVSGNNNHCIQLATSARASLIANQANGKQIARFTNSFMNCVQSTTTGVGMICVAKQHNTTSAAYFVNGANSTYLCFPASTNTIADDANWLGYKDGTVGTGLVLTRSTSNFSIFSAFSTSRTRTLTGIGWGVAPSTYMDIAEMIILANYISDGDMRAIWAYLKAKWGTP